MDGLELIRFVVSALGGQRLRSFLSALGVGIGVAAVITMVALGEGAQAAVQEQLEGLGANTLTVRAGSGFWGGGSRDRGARMSIDDAYAIIEKTTSISSVVPVLRGPTARATSLVCRAISTTSRTGRLQRR